MSSRLSTPLWPSPRRMASSALGPAADCDIGAPRNGIRSARYSQIDVLLGARDRHVQRNTEIRPDQGDGERHANGPSARRRRWSGARAPPPAPDGLATTGVLARIAPANIAARSRDRSSWSAGSRGSRRSAASSSVRAPPRSPLRCSEIPKMEWANALAAGSRCSRRCARAALCVVQGGLEISGAEVEHVQGTDSRTWSRRSPRSSAIARLLFKAARAASPPPRVYIEGHAQGRLKMHLLKGPRAQPRRARRSARSDQR